MLRIETRSQGTQWIRENVAKMSEGFSEVWSWKMREAEGKEWRETETDKCTERGKQSFYEISEHSICQVVVTATTHRESWHINSRACFSVILCFLLLEVENSVPVFQNINFSFNMLITLHVTKNYVAAWIHTLPCCVLASWSWLGQIICIFFRMRLFPIYHFILTGSSSPLRSHRHLCGSRSAGILAVACGWA